MFDEVVESFSGTCRGCIYRAIVDAEKLREIQYAEAFEDCP